MREWWTPADLAAENLPGLPGSREEIARYAERSGWRHRAEYPVDPNGVWRRRAGRGGGYEYRIDVLPLEAEARAAIIAAERRPGPGECA